MYCKLAIVGLEQRARAVLLPYEKRSALQIEQWQACLLEGERLVVYDAPIALYLADWLARYVQKTVRKEVGSRTGTRDQLQRYQHVITQQLVAAGKRLPGHWVAYESIAGMLGSSNVMKAGKEFEGIDSVDSFHSHQYKDSIGSLHHSPPPINECHQNNQRIQALQQHITSLLQGRKLLYDEWLSLGAQQVSENKEQLLAAFRYAVLQGSIKLRSAVQLVKLSGKRPLLRCLRCYETELTESEHHCPFCGEHCYYCKTCLQMGRARTCSVVVMGHYRSPTTDAPNIHPPSRVLDLEAFGLSDAQQMATTKALTFVHQRLTTRRLPQSIRAASTTLSRQFLLWAVTGAGKTEMIFPLVAYMTKLGGRVLLATPRRDVVLELAPRLRKAFPELSIATLYGGSEERWQHGQLIIATTHQLMRFHQAFDLVIIDELDAFPYHGDERLYRVAEQCSTKHGVRLLLSATPPAYLQRELNKGRLAYVKLPVRYHRHPLPVPIRLKTPLIAEQLKKRTLPSALIQALHSSLKDDAQVFIFLQRIAHTEAYAALLRASFPHVSIQATSSQDAQRAEKVIAFRNRDIRILVTTTILERGVTVPRSHVYICDAEAELFDEASLVQMAGRAGRSGDAPNGAVYFLSQQWNEAQRKAVKQIKSMNELASDLGYLLPQYRSKRQGVWRK
ncbi:DEAD/DEAH box helicase [Paenibacillus sp. FSL W7-1287]|uniref:DEAD/DEAH box helicase n=1 Tax=Paenibacillus sp. FSL W7-1287 TaxID=2954538 RepID=UPI0030F7F94F